MFNVKKIDSIRLSVSNFEIYCPENHRHPYHLAGIVSIESGGVVPKTCQICNKPFGKHFIDGKSKYGPWALMCESCWDETGYELGIGRGQKYITKTKMGIEGFDER